MFETGFLTHGGVQHTRLAGLQASSGHCLPSPWRNVGSVCMTFTTVCYCTHSGEPDLSPCAFMQAFLPRELSLNRVVCNFTSFLLEPHTLVGALLFCDSSPPADLSFSDNRRESPPLCAHLKSCFTSLHKDNSDILQVVAFYCSTYGIQGIVGDKAKAALPISKGTAQ